MSNPFENMLENIIDVEWKGHGENDREEFYCPSCSAHSIDSSEIEHFPHCPFLKAKQALTALRSGELVVVDGKKLIAEQLAEVFHETYEYLAAEYEYETRKDSAVPWKDVPESNKRLVVATAAEVARYLKRRGEPPCTQ